MAVCMEIMITQLLRKVDQCIRMASFRPSSQHIRKLGQKFKSCIGPKDLGFMPVQRKAGALHFGLSFHYSPFQPWVMLFVFCPGLGITSVKNGLNGLEMTIEI